MKPDSLDDWVTHIGALHHNVIEMGLERIQQVYSRLLREAPVVPETETTPKIITFAGTNGKGSTLAVVEALALAGQARVGAYTSPHLLRFNERIRVQGTDCSDQALCTAFERVEQARGDIALTYFEFTTLVAFDLFRSSRLDFWLLEVGLGGRLDAVNIIDPNIAVITTVDLDHQSWLGNDRETIGREKAGILRPDTPVFLGDPDMPRTVLEKAKELNCPTYQCGRDFHLTEGLFSGNFRSSAISFPVPAPPDLPVNNIATALNVAYAGGIDLTFLQAVSAFPPLALRGRFQCVRKAPKVILDVAHNPHAARYLADWLSRESHQGPAVAVFSALQDKDVKAVISALAGSFDFWCVFPLDNERAMAGEQLKMQIERGDAHAALYSTAGEALREALNRAGSLGTVVVFGSFFTVAAILETGIISPAD